MANKQQRIQNANNYRKLMGALPSGRRCPNCKKELMHGEGHFVPPSFGEEGFYACGMLRAKPATASGKQK